MDDKLKNELAKIIDGLAGMADDERSKSEPYKALFKKITTHRELLSNLSDEGMSQALDACQLYKEKFDGSENRETLEFFLLVPFLSYRLEKIIEDSEGYSCCVDKAFYLLSKKLESGDLQLFKEKEG